jgi:competence protein ComEC
VIASAFGKVPVAGLVINIAAIPLFAIIFPIVLLCSLPAFFGLPFSREIADMCEYLLESWDILSEKLVELMPWNVVQAFPLTVFAVILFFAAAAYASGISLKRIPGAALMFPLLVLLFA